MSSYPPPSSRMRFIVRKSGGRSPVSLPDPKPSPKSVEDALEAKKQRAMDTFLASSEMSPTVQGEGQEEKEKEIPSMGMTRDKINELAKRYGMENPERLSNKKDLIRAILDLI